MGAMCQAYALRRTIQSLFPGDLCGVIDFEEEKRIHPPSIRSVFTEKGGKGVKGAVKGLIHCGLAMQAKWASGGRSACQDFVNEDMGTFHDTRISKDGRLDTRQEAEPYDVLVAGSDQVWGRGFGMHPYLFCETVKGSPKKVAYAPSMGKLSLFDDASKARLRQYLTPFSALSCREQDGAAFLAGLTGRECPVVLDPTLLLPPEEYRKLARRPENAPEGDFVFSYQVTWAKNCTRLARTAAKKLGLPLVIQRAVIPYSYYTACGPREFLWYIANAKQVVTSSFHGTALSLALGTPCISVGTNTPQTRITNLLQAAGCSECYISGTENDKLPIGIGSNRYSSLAKQIDMSKAYLTTAIR